jgi:transglutaminase-like putative cysteine protease
VTTAELGFMGWAVAWVLGASIVLLQLAWEQSAQLRRGPLQRAPLGRAVRWTAGVLVLAGGFFMVLPRTTLALRPLPFSMAGLMGTEAGLSETLDLGGSGPIAGNSEVVMRVLPPAGLDPEARARLAERYALLRGLALERLDGLRWEPQPTTWERRVAFLPASDVFLRREAELYIAPSMQLIIPLPYGEEVDLQGPPVFPLRAGPGDSVRWAFPAQRWLSLGVSARPAASEPTLPEDGRWLRTRRFATLTFVPEEAGGARRWSQELAPALPGEEPRRPEALARRLTTALRRFGYTTDNPSGRAENPLQDFMERTRAGHCEYFASSMAFMLRARGVPARVVNGYRLGAWSEEGGYFLVTQNEAHAWVEYYDDAAGAWRVADPTPAAPPAPGSTGWRAALRRWADAAQYRWDRYVVRFSDQDQMDGAEWLKQAARRLPSWRPGRREAVAAGALAALLVLARLLWAHGHRPAADTAGFHRIWALRPLLRRAGPALAPAGGETARAWLLRLAAARPDLDEGLRDLARDVDAAAYGEAGTGSLRARVKALLKAWR